jgi:hypothetical protein
MWLWDREPYGGKRKHDVASIRGVTISGYISAARKQLELRTGERLIYTVLSKELVRRLQALPSPVRFKEPIPLSVVLALLNDTDISIGIRAAVALAWFLTLRLGESMLSHLTEVYNATRTTRREDVEFVSDNSGVVNAVRITTRGAKNDPYNEGGIKILCKATQPGALCPVNLFMECWSVTEHLGCKLHEPLIRHPDGRLVTPQQVRKQIKRHAQLLGYNPDWFGNHSTRIQGATRMLAANVPMQTMLKQGNWKTDRGIMPYMRHSGEMQRTVSNALALQPRSTSQRNVDSVAESQLFCRSKRSVAMYPTVLAPPLHLPRPRL